MLARAFSAAPKLANNTVNQAVTSITRHAPAEVRRINEKIGAEGVKSYQTVMESDEYYRWLDEKTADELAREAERDADPDKRDLLYAEAARKALAAEQAEKAQTSAARLKNRAGYVGLIEEVEIAVPLAATRRESESSQAARPA